jgi:glycosyltransferase involved in cell wall biosynthesis
MEKIEKVRKFASAVSTGNVPVSVIIAARNEAKNLPRCLQALTNVGEVYVIDSQSSDETVEIARSHGAQIVQFHYQGGWPKKRQWAMNTLPIAYDWILLLDADEVLTTELSEEIRSAIQNPAIDGYSILLRTWFLGQVLRHGDVGLWKLSLFRRGKGHYECRLKEQVVVEGATARLRHPLIHHNVESLSRYIQKHDEYSNWESHVLLQRGEDKELPPLLSGTQAQRRRWLKRRLFALPGSPLLLFLYRYVVRFGFLDGVPGLIYCGFQAVQMFHTKAKIYELKSKRTEVKG